MVDLAVAAAAAAVAAVVMTVVAEKKQLAYHYYYFSNIPYPIHGHRPHVSFHHSIPHRPGPL